MNNIVHQCCGCSCDVCEFGHSSGQHTDECWGEKKMNELTDLEQKLLKALCAITYYEEDVDCFYNAYVECADLTDYMGKEVADLMKQYNDE